LESYDESLTAPEQSPEASAKPSPLVAVPSPTPVPQSTSASPVKPTGKIIGGILGSIAGLLLVLVAFLFRRQQLKGSEPHGLPASTSTSHTLLPGVYVRRWFQKRPLGKTDTPTRFSFNPSLFVLPIMNRNRSHSRVSPSSPNTTRRTKNEARHTPYSRPPDAMLLAPLPLPTTIHLSPSILDTHTHLAADASEPLSIAEWRRRIQQDADATPPRFMSEVDLSSYYESDSYQPPPPPRPPPKPTIRRFTVVNN
jgi:hypothetical protein